MTEHQIDPSGQNIPAQLADVERNNNTFATCTCGRCDRYKAPELWCVAVYQENVDLEVRRVRVLRKIDAAASLSQRHREIYEEVAAVYRAHINTGTAAVMAAQLPDERQHQPAQRCTCGFDAEPGECAFCVARAELVAVVVRSFFDLDVSTSDTNFALVRLGLVGDPPNANSWLLVADGIRAYRALAGADVEPTAKCTETDFSEELWNELQYMDCSGLEGLAGYRSPDKPGQCYCCHCNICRIADRLSARIGMSKKQSEDLYRHLGEALGKPLDADVQSAELARRCRCCGDVIRYDEEYCYAEDCVAAND